MFAKMCMLALVASLAGPASAFGPVGRADSQGKAKTIVEIAVATPDLSTLVAALKAGGLVDTLSGKGPFTVFAPSNEAFAKLPPLYLKLLLNPANLKTLQQVLKYHVVAGAAAFAKDLKNGEKIRTVELEDVTVGLEKSLFKTTVKINDATVTTADVAASNGVVHIVDTVLTPPDMLMNIVELAQDTADLSTLVAALTAGDLVGTLSGPGPFTVFAPSNAAFAKLPPLYLQLLLKPENIKELQTLLTYHVVSGTAAFAKDLTNGEQIMTVEGMDVTVKLIRSGVSTSYVKINDATVTTADVAASNGVVHIIDTVLMPSDMPGPAPAPPAPPTPPAPVGPSIVELAVATPSLSTLVAALKAADLVGTLSGPGPFTVFAPTNEAFAALPAGALAKLLQPRNKQQLQNILTYHVLAGAVKFENLQIGGPNSPSTVEGSYVSLVRPCTDRKCKRGSKLFINRLADKTCDPNGRQRPCYEAQGISFDNIASNGVVHIIDGVLRIPDGVYASLE